MEDQPRNGNVDDQQPQSDNIDEQQPAKPANNDAAVNPCANQQAPPNQIANVPHGLVVQEQQQLPLNNPDPPIPMNRSPRRGLFSLPPHIRQVHPLLIPKITKTLDPDIVLYIIPHFHFYFGNQHWTFNDFSQRIPTTGYRHYPHPMVPINICHLLPTNKFQYPLENSIIQSHLLDQQPYLMPNHLVSRMEIEPGIFEEIYSPRRSPFNRLVMFGSRRCMCQDFVGCNLENDQMLTVIMNTPNLTKRFSMTIHQEIPFEDLFSAYFGFTDESSDTIFVACGKRLGLYETPESVGMKTNENIYTFL